MDTNLITHRRREVEAEITRLKTQITELETELTELETAERVFARLTGAKRPETGTPYKPKPSSVSRQAANEPPLTEKIVMVLAEAHRRGLKGMEPAGIFDAIIEKGWSATKDNVRATTWRFWRDGRLSKVADTALYSVPEKETTADLLSPTGEQPAAVSEPEAQVSLPLPDVSLG